MKNINQKIDEFLKPIELDEKITLMKYMFYEKDFYEDFVKDNYLEIVCSRCNTKQLKNKYQVYLWDVIRRIKENDFDSVVGYYEGECFRCRHIIRIPLPPLFINVGNFSKET